MIPGPSLGNFSQASPPLNLKAPLITNTGLVDVTFCDFLALSEISKFFGKKSHRSMFSGSGLLAEFIQNWISKCVPSSQGNQARYSNQSIYLCIKLPQLRVYCIIFKETWGHNVFIVPFFLYFRTAINIMVFKALKSIKGATHSPLDHGSTVAPLGGHNVLRGHMNDIQCLKS